MRKWIFFSLLLLPTFVQSALFLEPSFNYAVSGSGTLRNKTYEIEEIMGDFAFGYQATGNFFKMDASYSFFKLDSGTGVAEDFDRIDYGFSLGKAFFENGWRLWGGLIYSSMVSLADSNAYEGSGYKYGTSFRIYKLFHLLLEGRNVTYNKSTNSAGVETALHGEMQLKVNTFYVGISMPWIFFTRM